MNERKKADLGGWHAFFRDSLIDKSTRLKDRKQAQRWPILWKCCCAAEEERTTRPSGVRSDFPEHVPGNNVDRYLSLLCGSMARNQKAGNRPGHFPILFHNDLCILDFLGLKADRDLSEVARADLIAFRNSLAGKLSSTSINRYISVLRMLFKTAKRDGYVLENPVEFVELVKKDRNQGRRAFNIPEIKAFSVIADPEWQSLIKFGLYAGQRLGDLASLTWANIDLEHREIHLTTRKTGKRLRVPLSDALHAHILKLPHSDSQEGAPPAQL
jgi:hypothetical protein